MKNFLVILTMICLVKIIRAEVTPFPFYGELIEINEAPYIAAIYVVEFYRCTGSYISELWVLTSGYCIVGKVVGDVSVVMGTNKVNHVGEKKNVVNLVLHPNYNAVPLRNDVGLVNVASPFTVGHSIQPIQISDKAIDNATSPCRLIGWGVGINLTRELFYDDPIVLRRATMEPIVDDSCKHILANEVVRYGKDFIDNNVICAEGRNGDACLGDVGAPLVCEEVLVGIVSMVMGECGTGKVSLYTDVSKFRRWINANTMPILSTKSSTYSLHRCNSNWFIAFRMCVLMILCIIL